MERRERGRQQKAVAKKTVGVNPLVYAADARLVIGKGWVQRVGPCLLDPSANAGWRGPQHKHPLVTRHNVRGKAWVQQAHGGPGRSESPPGNAPLGIFGLISLLR